MKNSSLQMMFLFLVYFISVGAVQFQQKHNVQNFLIFPFHLTINPDEGFMVLYLKIKMFNVG